ncbi:Xaa-Pro peptidase family protein [Aestuariivirga sp.]|uniref:M24 family metallopeptidase n=1 Tax=Aestuariivirga sp. TaxID=2650926 RepID=UPI0025BF1BFF|nr:Xaa-Pro peptidase family protein [Aestuariivirga sp.]MCA3554948.1 aminopeptidase P family protein [Aestuariivirga sp.]
MLEPLMTVLARTGLDAVVLVPGANFRRVFRKDFHQMERPLAVIVPREGSAVAVAPQLEMGSFAPIGFPGKVFPWRDEQGYMGAFMAAGEALPQLREGTRVGVEGQRMRVFDLFALQQALPGAEFVDIHGEISKVRLHKTPEEVELQRKAIRISEAALEATLAEVKVGMTETEVERILLRNLFSQGADGLSFAPIVAAGDNAAKPHAHARPDYHLKPGDALLIDFGGACQGYCADITRTFFVREVSDYDRAFYETVLAANAKGREVSRPGITASDVDDAVLTVLEQSQFAQFARHKTGHGLGLDVHEAPQIMRGNRDLLEPGMVFTIEPGLYREGEAGVRIEDDVVVTENGIECLTSFPRELRIVG